MRLRCLAGAYAGRIQDYGPAAGLAALRAGTAERIIDAPPVPVPQPIPVAVSVVTPTPVAAVKQTKRHGK